MGSPFRDIKPGTLSQLFVAKIDRWRRKWSYRTPSLHVLRIYHLQFRLLLQLIECFHMTSWRPYWCPKTMKRRPVWCPKPIVWELYSFRMQTLSIPINLHRCWPREWKHSIEILTHQGKECLSFFLWIAGGCGFIFLTAASICFAFAAIVVVVAEVK